MRERLHPYNDKLDPLPDDGRVLAALHDLYDEQKKRSSREFGITTAQLAGRLGIQAARRSGRGAVAGSWSGFMSPALRLAPRMLKLERQGLIWSTFSNDERYRKRWVPR